MCHELTRWLNACGFLALIIAVVTGSCSDSNGPDTEYLGEYQVSVEYVMMPDTISTGDTLLVHIDGSTDPSGCLYEVRFDIGREPHGLEMTVWADVYAWIGAGPPPPCGVAWGEYKAPPPFEEGFFFVTINQPDGSALTDSVFVRS